MKGVVEKMTEALGTNFAFSGAMTFVTGLFGGWDLSIKVLIVAIVIDILTGILKGSQNEGIRSRRIREGLVTKMVYFLVIILTFQFDLLLGNETPVFRTMVAWMYIFTETVSVLENCYELGVPIPKKLYDILAIVKDKSGGTMDKEDFESLK